MGVAQGMMNHAQPPQIVSVLEPKIGPTRLATTQRHTIILPAGVKLESFHYETFSTIPVQCSSRGPPSHALRRFPVLPCWFSIPIQYHKIAVNPWSILKHGSSITRFSHELMDHNGIYLKTLHLNKGLNVIFRGMGMGAFTRYIRENATG